MNKLIITIASVGLVAEFVTLLYLVDGICNH
jgi:hypothetical protein